MMNEKTYCICHSTDGTAFMISCDNCNEWFHGDCLGITEECAKQIDFFYCDLCKSRNSALKTTYKSSNKSEKYSNKRNRKRKIKNKRRKYTSNVEISERKTEIDQKRYVKISSPSLQMEIDDAKDLHAKEIKSRQLPDMLIPNHNSKGIENLDIFYANAVNRKAKMTACENIRSVSQKGNNTVKRKAATGERKQKKTETEVKSKQCYGPGCVYSARKNSKYCSDSCGMKLATNRILEILPQRLQQWKIIPCAADELNRKQLTEIRKKKRLIENNLEAVEKKIAEFVNLIRKSETSLENIEITTDSDDECNSTIYCKLCGAEIMTKVATKHMENCYKRQERRLLLTSSSSPLNDMEWNIFCNHKMSRKVYCKKLRVLCPLHYKSRSEDEPCGYPLPRTTDFESHSGKFCGRLKKNCLKHVAWEEINRAQLDMDKMRLLIQLGELEEEEEKVRKAMAARGDLLNLMCHQTIVH
ncbi:CXXC-type zinc finger protein 1-like [Stegodyphus dumicola]|uniref:CXXC-type zinc finger protein 1-like n=1 Tax=Stegodyphus dumicola TaxID=202533 RepID=UPI0015B13971|nr:CXXC-type zinc finger protein 1-like [Stegodyphus dumicola]